MSPNLYDTTTSTNSVWSYSNGYYSSYTPVYPRTECKRYEDITNGWSDNHYISVIVSRDEYHKIEKILHKMKLEMCKRGWAFPNYYYHAPKLKPIPLRNVKYDGRGWANSK